MPMTVFSADEKHDLDAKGLSHQPKIWCKVDGICESQNKRYLSGIKYVSRNEFSLARQQWKKSGNF